MAGMMEILYNDWVDKRELKEITSLLSYFEEDLNTIKEEYDERVEDLWKKLLEMERNAYYAGLRHGTSLVMEVMGM